MVRFRMSLANFWQKDGLLNLFFVVVSECALFGIWLEFFVVAGLFRVPFLVSDG